MSVHIQLLSLLAWSVRSIVPQNTWDQLCKGDISFDQLKLSKIERTCIFFPEAARGRRNPSVSSLNLNENGVLPRKLIFLMSSLSILGIGMQRSALLNLMEKSSTEQTSWWMFSLRGSLKNTLTSPRLMPSVSKFDINQKWCLILLNEWAKYSSTWWPVPQQNIVHLLTTNSSQWVFTEWSAGHQDPDNGFILKHQVWSMAT